ncbi:MAG TPA: formylglycine-generating enzyme family protein [Bacteroidales bacterium]|nr:formylglycine-generating enzyme family protein [Bacteroidales bacterium]
MSLMGLIFLQHGPVKDMIPGFDQSAISNLSGLYGEAGQPATWIDPGSQEPLLHKPELLEKGVTRARLATTIEALDPKSEAERGFCWNETGNPVLSDNKKKAAATTTGRYTCELEGLSKATVYHLRPYLFQGETVLYGEELIFTTDAFMNGIQVSLRYVEGGTFTMGCTLEPDVCYFDEMPAHEVEVGSFQMSTFEITSGQFCAFINARGLNPDGTYEGQLYIDINDADCPIRYAGRRFVPKPGMAEHPASEVSWHGAQAFSEWIGGTLPTEAEWEYAAKGGQESRNFKYSGSNNLEEVAWYQDNASEKSQPVGKKKPNELGLYDMSGNVWEWCYDWYAFEYYQVSPSETPSGPESGDSRVIRGGAWNMDGWNCRISNRSSKGPGITYNYYGFRLLIPVR